MKFALSVLFSLCLLGWASCLPPSLHKPNDLEVIGGQNADIKDYPYQVSLRKNGFHYCGGSLISPEFVVTASHCVDGIFINLISVFAGSTNRGLHGQVSYLKAIHMHPQYSNTTYDYDIAILHLITPFKVGPTLRPVELVEEGSVLPEGTNCTVTGWGRTQEKVRFTPFILQKVNLPIFNKQACINDYPDLYPVQVTDRMICAGYADGGKDACQGDSGGPLACNKKLVGVISWGLGCGHKNRPGIFSSIAVLRSFIKEKTGI